MTGIRMRPESVRVAMLLTAVGGYLDAYTYVQYRVFANAQSGNVVLLGLDVSTRSWSHALTRLWPVLAFGVGILMVEFLATESARAAVRRPVRVALGFEILALAVLASLPQHTPAAVVTVTVAFVAAIQFDTFRNLGDSTYTTLMTSGNLRALITAAFRWRHGRDAAAGRRTGRFAAVVLAFAVGAVLGAIATRHWQITAAAVPAGVLAVVLILLVAETRRLERP